MLSCFGHDFEARVMAGSDLGMIELHVGRSCCMSNNPHIHVYLPKPERYNIKRSPSCSYEAMFPRVSEV